MFTNIDKYMERVLEQLEYNASEEEKELYGTFSFSNEQINGNMKYFESCMKTRLSPYKALCFFGDYLRNEYTI